MRGANGKKRNGDNCSRINNRNEEKKKSKGKYGWLHFLKGLVAVEGVGITVSCAASNVGTKDHLQASSGPWQLRARIEGISKKATRTVLITGEIKKKKKKEC